MTTIRFSLLGPLRVAADGVPLDLGARQQRLTLALLLAVAGTPVDMSDILGLLWGPAAPPSATNVIHRTIGALRRTLEPDLPVRATGRFLIRQVSGYQLRVDESSLDLLAFRHSVEIARGHVRAGRDEQAVQAYLHGSQLWRGRCAGGLEPESGTHPVFLALEAERARAVRDAADVALRSGHGSAVVPMLRQAAERDPFDEAVQSRMLLALAADGRQAEAVELFQEFRAQLRSRMGIGPGAELREAYSRVLAQRTGRTPAPTAAAHRAPGTPRPAQLPADLPFFSGREALLARMTALAGAPQRSGGTTVLAIDGMPGVGKTATAVRLAHLLALAYPDGQLYADLRGFDEDDSAMGPAEALRGFLSSLGTARTTIPHELHAQAGMFRSALAPRRMLILLDNCRDLHQIRHLLPAAPGCLVIATSRIRLSGLVAATGAHHFTITPPSLPDARAELGRRLSAAQDATALDAANDIIDSCGRLPLAMAVVSARATALGTPLADIADELRETRGSLDGFDSDDAQTSLRAVFSWSYRALSAPAARLFQKIPMHTGPDLTSEAAAALLDMPPGEGRALISELHRGNLVTESRPGHFEMHTLLRSYATELGEEPT